LLKNKKDVSREQKIQAFSQLTQYLTIGSASCVIVIGEDTACDPKALHSM